MKIRSIGLKLIMALFLLILSISMTGCLSVLAHVLTGGHSRSSYYYEEDDDDDDDDRRSTPPKRVENDDDDSSSGSGPKRSM